VFAAGSSTSANISENTPTTTVVHTATATDNVGVTAYAFEAGGADNNKFNINAVTGALTFLSSPDFEASGSAAGTNTYAVRVRASDAAGNSTVQTVTVNVTDVFEYTLGQPTINLGEYGNLIAPVHVDGKWYYVWDANGDGLNNQNLNPNGKFASDGSVINAAGTGRQYDFMTHNVLDNIFRFASDFTTLDTDNETDNVHRFAQINGVKLALPTIGDGSISISTLFLKFGTAVDNVPAGENNPTYDDLLAIWDAHNGTSTNSSSSGIPSGWAGTVRYWSATPSTNGNAGLFFLNGSISNANESENGYVALQVL
jgi:hypothetical protein